MKKTKLLLLTIPLALGTMAVVPDVFAKDFSGQEDKYIALCASSTLSSNDEKVCKEFNTYLKDKNKDLKSNIKDTEQAVADSQASLDDIDNAIQDISTSITDREKEIEYLNTSIKNLEDDITAKEEELRDRMYYMQTYVNSNTYVDFIFGASSFSDMFSRLNSISELTSYDKQLVKNLADAKNEVEQQKKTVNTALANLDNQKKQQESLQQQYLAKYQEQNADLVAKQKEVMENSNTSEKIDDNLAALAAAAEQSRVEGVTQVTPPSNNNSSGNGNSNNNNSDGSSGGNTTPPITNGNSDIGVAIANYALSKQGAPYVWGANGPDSFDCSGLVYWAHRQAGINFSRPTAARLAGMGTAVSYSNLQPGDIITFKTSPSYVSHVGIYIGSGKMVHAPVPGQDVQVANLNVAYWQNTLYNCRRLY